LCPMPESGSRPNSITKWSNSRLGWRFCARSFLSATCAPLAGADGLPLDSSVNDYLIGPYFEMSMRPVNFIWPKHRKHYCQSVVKWFVGDILSMLNHILSSCLIYFIFQLDFQRKSNIFSFPNSCEKCARKSLTSEAWG
jgi:hypothetical protein